MTLVRNIESYALGEWYKSTDTGAVIQHAITGEPVAKISSRGLDFADMLAYARDTGGPALKQYTFHQRAIMLKQLAAYLMERKELFYDLSRATGATRADSWIDIEGGIGTLFAYSSKARRDMPNDTVYIDGDQESLSKTGTFTGIHIYTPIAGVAVHINAYNFPCWGMLEKLAPTLIAGVPVIVKPGSQTAYLTELMFRHVIESGILPTGAVQLVCGGTGNLLDLLDYQDAVSFTGSASTGLKLKQNPSIASRAVRFMMEADSLNCSILGSDVEPGSAEFDLYIKEVVREMTVKAGQKCTAIRRAIVPANRLDAVAEALSTRLAKITIGNPDSESVRMGALAGLDQRRDVMNNLGKLSSVNEIIFGNPNKVDVIDADPEKGAFMSPILMHCKDPNHGAVHDIEAFGPVCTLIPSQSDEEAIALAAKGKGSLVGSLVSNDKSVARTITLGAAPHHGRLLILNDACAKESTGHGSPLPMLIHGGPGRAGGSEEMGGIRGVKHYMQRTALQGSPDMLGAITNAYMRGGTRNTDTVHPFKKYFEELEIGDTLITEKRTITVADIEAFAELSGDKFYAHMNEEAAARNPFFDGRVAHGYFLISLAAGLFVWPDEGPVLANTGLENLNFAKPVYPGDVVQVLFTCKQKKNRENEAYGEVRWDTTLINQNEEVCATYDVLTGVANKQ